MRRLQWEDLPGEARAAVEAELGTVVKVESAVGGLTRGVAARLDTADRGVFLKAVPLDDPSAHLYARERSVDHVLPSGVPAARMLWSADVGGWLLSVFERIDGREADLSPDSPDVSRVLDIVGRLGRVLTPCPSAVRNSVVENVSLLRGRAEALLNDPPDDLPEAGAYADALGGLEEIALVGDTLLHADLHEENLIVADERIYVIDWALACRGAAWLEPVLLLPRLIVAGHTPGEAEGLVARVPAWEHAPSEAVTGLAVAWTLFRDYTARNGPRRIRRSRARAAEAGKTWLRHRRIRARS